MDLKRVLNIYSINYDFMPTIPYAAKTLWIQLGQPVPIPIGTKVKIVSSDPSFVAPKETLQVRDVIGTRVMLTVPSHLEEGHWGYVTRTMRMGYRNWTYGSGRPVAQLIITPLDSPL